MKSVPNPDPNFHVQRVGAQLEELIRHLEDDLHQFDEPRARALFETACEVMTGLRKAFSRYRERTN